MAKAFDPSLDPSILDYWPAMEVRFEQGLPSQRQQAWVEKWGSAGGKVFDGRLIALKNDPVWRVMTGAKRLKGEARRDGVFESRDVKRTDAQALGLIQLMEVLDTKAFNEEAPASLTRKVQR